MEARPVTQHPTGPAGTDPPPPPRCPDGWVTGPPDFVGVGAARCGTTWWFRQITSHPEICFDSSLHTKEIHFFNGMRDFQRLPDHFADLYTQHFPRPAEAGRIGVDAPLHVRFVGHGAAASGGSRRPHPADAPRPCGTVCLRLPTPDGAGAQGRRITAPGARGRARGVARLLPPAGAARARDVSARECVDPAVRALLGRLRGPARPDWEFLGVEPGFRPPSGAGTCRAPRATRPFSTTAVGETSPRPTPRMRLGWPRSRRRSTSRYGRACTIWPDRAARQTVAARSA